MWQPIKPEDETKPNQTTTQRERLQIPLQYNYSLSVISTKESRTDAEQKHIEPKHWKISKKLAE